MADLGNQKIKETYQLVLQTDASGNLQNLTGGTPTLIISGQTTLTGGVSSANPTPRIKFDDYYDNSGGPSVSHIDLYGGTYGFGITSYDLDYTSDKNHRFYANGESTPGLTIDGDTKMVSINNAGTPAYNLDVTGDIRCTDDLFVNDDLVVDGFSSLDSVRIGATQTNPGTGKLYVEENLTVDVTTFYADKTNGVGVGTSNPTHSLTVSGSGESFNQYLMPIGTYLNIANGQARSTFFSDGIFDPNLAVGYTLRILHNDTGAFLGDILINTYGPPSIYHDATSIVTMQATNILLSTGGTIPPPLFAVYNGTGTTFQVSGNTVMSGSTDLLDIFASSNITNQDVYWSASTGGISNSGLTGNVGIGTTTPNEKLTVSGAISGDSTIAATQYNSTTSIYGYNLNGGKALWKEDDDIQVGNVAVDTDIIGTSINLQTATTINDNLTVTGNTNISGNTTVIGNVISANEDVYMFSNRGQGQTDITHWYGPNYQGVYNYSWSKDYGDDTEVLTLEKAYINAGILVPYNCILTGFFAIGHTNTGTAGYSCGLWYIIKSNLDPAIDITGDSPDSVTLTIAGTIGTTITPGAGAENKQPLTIDKRDSMSVALTAGSMIYPRVGDSAVVTDTTWNVYLKRT